MGPFAAPLDLLAMRARRGDPDAAVELERRVSPQLLFLVRSALRRSQSSDRLSREIRATAERLAPDYAKRSPGEQERVIHQVAGCLRGSVCGRLRSLCRDDRSVRETMVG